MGRRFILIFLATCFWWARFCANFYTLPETNSKPSQKETSFQPSIFRYKLTVSFRKGIEYPIKPSTMLRCLGCFCLDTLGRWMHSYLRGRVGVGAVFSVPKKGEGPCNQRMWTPQHWVLRLVVSLFLGDMFFYHLEYYLGSNMWFLWIFDYLWICWYWALKSR